MNVSVAWLRALAPSITDEPAELARRLSLQAVAVDLVEPVGEGIGDVLVGRVVSSGPHPDADRLSLCRVEAGGDAVDVVCGAPNVVEGALYPFVPPGGSLPGGLTIERRKIRGVTSHGMLCSERELGLGPDAAGIMRLADGLEPGMPLAQALGLPDTRFVLDVTPNRVDLACHVGVARELAPGGVADIALPEAGASWTPGWVDDAASAGAEGVRVTIEDAGRCPRYLAAVIRGVRVGPSPDWLRARLRAVGARPVNNVVDATNYVLLELNQPIHAFDLARLEGPEIRVRAAADGEELTTLDGRRHALGAAATVIADAVRPVALAGVMGGEDSEVTDATTDVLLECAAFDPRAVRHTAAATGISTDASYRFERGIDEAGLERALARCVELILAVAGGEAARAALRVGRPAPERRIVEVRPARVRALLGLRLSAEQIGGLLSPLGFEVEAAERLRVAVPTWRSDVTREVDLIEEIARRYGYERFPEESRAIRPSSVPDDPTWARRGAVRRLLESHGLYETRGLPMVAAERTREDRVPLRNPLSATESVLRTDLVPPLLDRVAHNFAHGRREVRLFEIGTVFALDPEGRGAEGRERYLEEVRVAVVFTGRRAPDHWSGTSADVDVWDLRGLAEDVCERLLGAALRPLGADAADPGAEPGGETGSADGGGAAAVTAAAAAADPSRPAFGAGGWLGDEGFAMFTDGRLAGLAGRVRAESLDAPPWAAPVYALEFRLDDVRLAAAPRYAARPAYPPVVRDLALLVAEGVTAARTEDALRAGAPGELVAVRPFDVYEGEELDGRRSVAWRLVFRAADRTLTDEEVDRHVDRIVAHLTEELDVRVRHT